MYAIVKTGGKQYRVQPDQWLLIERLPVDEGASVELQPLLYVDGSELIDGDAISTVSVQAKVLAHERGPKLRIVKFKPKRGYKRRNGHRQELTRIQITSIGRPGSATPASGETKSGAGAKAKAPPALEFTGETSSTSSEASDGS